MIHLPCYFSSSVRLTVNKICNIKHKYIHKSKIKPLKLFKSGYIHFFFFANKIEKINQRESILNVTLGDEILG